MYKKRPPERLISLSSVRYFITDTKIDAGKATFIIKRDRLGPKSSQTIPSPGRIYPKTMIAIIGMDTRNRG